jgi:hypothetical protein
MEKRFGSDLVESSREEEGLLPLLCPATSLPIRPGAA